MNVEAKQKPQQKQYQQHQQETQQQQQQQQHHAHYSYDKDIVCDDAQKHQLKHQHHSHQHHQQYEDQALNTSVENMQQYQHTHYPQQQYQQHQHRSKQQPQTPNQTPPYAQQRRVSNHQSQTQTQHKYSQIHSPHQSRHTSPHSHHSHSLHTSPHQSHQQVNSGNAGGAIETLHSSLTRTNQTTHRPSIQTASSHAHHHHHVRKRNRRNSPNANGNGSGGGGSRNSSFHDTHAHDSHNSQEHSTSRQHSSSCSKRHRSATDISSVSLNTCHDNCADREVQEIFVRKSCCSSSRTELAQCFAEDLYGSSRRPSSCCTSSDYCYQTDSTSLYGSRSSLSRNNSIKSASIAMRKRRALHQRQPSYTSISLRGIETTQLDGQEQQIGSLKSAFNRKRSKSTDADKVQHIGGGGGRVVLSPSKVTIERQISKDAVSQELPDYACSPSPIRWSFLADEKIQAQMDNWKNDDDDDDAEQAKPTQPRKPCRQSKHDHSMSRDERSLTSSRKRHESPFRCEFEESSTTVLFHQEGEAYNNCCNNYIQCNTYLDQDLQITSEDIHQYLSKGNHNEGDILNNSKNYPFQPSNALEFHYKNNFANNNATSGTGTGTGTGTSTNTNTTLESTQGAESVSATANARTSSNNHFRHNASKKTNLMQSLNESSGACSIGSTTANVNLSSSTNNINIMFNNSTTCHATGTQRHDNEVKFINNTNNSAIISSETYRSDCRSYERTNMSTDAFFDKPLGIDELPKEFDAANLKSATNVDCSEADGSSSTGQHSSPLLSPVQAGVSFESFDAPSDHNLLSQRGSCQFSSPTMHSPLSPSSPACSSLSASINPASTSYVLEPIHQQQQQAHNYHKYEQEQQQQHSRHHYHQRHHHHHHQQQHSPTTNATASSTQHTHYTHNQQAENYHHHHHHHHHHAAGDSSKLSNAFKKVRKRARKYTDFLRKK